MDSLHVFHERILELLICENNFSIIFYVGGFIIIALWLGFSAFVAQLSEVANRSPLYNFFITLIFPFIGVFIVFSSLKSIRSKQKEMSNSIEDTNKQVSECSSNTSKIEKDENDSTTFTHAAPVVYDKNYFSDLVNKIGNDTCFDIELEGRVVNVQRIIDCLPNVTLIEIQDETGAIHTMRIPYSKIISVSR